MRRLFFLTFVLIGCGDGGTTPSTDPTEDAAAETAADASDASDGTAETTADAQADTVTDTTVADSTPPPDTGADTKTPPADAKPDVAPKPCTESGAATFGGHCYFPLAAQGWVEAKKACEAAGAHLVTITSEGEQTFVQTLGGVTNRWIGLERPVASPSAPESFKWITGEAKTIEKWGLLEPANRGTCAHLRAADALWADAECVKSYVPICERE